MNVTHDILTLLTHANYKLSGTICLAAHHQISGGGGIRPAATIFTQRGEFRAALGPQVDQRARGSTALVLNFTGAATQEDVMVSLSTCFAGQFVRSERMS
jgi:hypothetical protein